MPASYKPSLTLLIAGAAVLLGAGLRLHNLRDHSMSHVEMYVPNIPMGTNLSVPDPRMDLGSVVRYTLGHEAHPPGYYVFMWFVTKLFGTGTLAMRLPSFLFGVVSIGLVFWLGVLIRQPIAGCAAAAFLALNGLHIVWSETARMYSMACFLSLLATILLLLLARSDRRRRPLEIGYALLLLLGLVTQLFFWALLAAHIVWVLGNALARKGAVPRLLSVQILVVILASPLLVSAVYQSVNDPSSCCGVTPVARQYLRQYVREYVQFNYLIPGWDDSWGPGKPGSAPVPMLELIALRQRFVLPRLILLSLSLLLVIVGVWRLKPGGERLLSVSEGSFGGAWLAAAVLAFLPLIAVFVYGAIAGHAGAKPTLKYARALTPLPLLLVLAATLLRKSWDRLQNWCSSSLQFLQGAPSLVWMLALGPLMLREFWVWSGAVTPAWVQWDNAGDAGS
jgi:4-amino-4-deoxy-L-arabinose transferase-like glycosyltransferase